MHFIAAARPHLGTPKLPADRIEFEPLRAEERVLLFDLVAARLAVGVTISAWRVKQHPENREYIVGDDAAHWRLLERLEELEPELRGAFEGAALARSFDAEPT